MLLVLTNAYYILVSIWSHILWGCLHFCSLFEWDDDNFCQSQNNRKLELFPA